MEIQEFVVNNVIHVEDFSSKKLFENPEKAKVTSTFDVIFFKASVKLLSLYTPMYEDVSID